MGSMWCKPSQFTDDCSPKLNINAILSRLSSQMCPSGCRYSHSGSRSHTKPRPRNEAVSKGCRPVISPPLMQPIPPPRKKRKHIQELSRSDEHLCSSHLPTSTPLRAANSLPVLCLPISQTRLMHHEVLESIKEETMPSIMREMDDLESLPISEVYFLRKEGTPPTPVFEAIPKDIAERTMTMENSGVTNMANSNFLDRSNSNHGQTRIETDVVERVTDKSKEIVETETIVKRIEERNDDFKSIRDKTQDCEPKETIDELDKGSVVGINNKEIDTNLECKDKGIDSKENLNGKKWQDVKSKWLQNILIGSDATENNLNDNRSIPLFIPKDLRDGGKIGTLKQKPSQKIDDVPEPQNENDSNVIGNSGDDSHLIVTPEFLNDTMQRLNSITPNRDEIFNNRNLVFNSQNLKIDDCVLVNDKDCTVDENFLSVAVQTGKKDDRTKNTDIISCQPSSRKSSRRSSITDSLQEFESSIYEMLQESAKANASDEDDSFIALHKQTLDSRQGT